MKNYNVNSSEIKLNLSLSAQSYSMSYQELLLNLWKFFWTKFKKIEKSKNDSVLGAKRVINWCSEILNSKFIDHKIGILISNDRTLFPISHFYFAIEFDKSILISCVPCYVAYFRSILDNDGEKSRKNIKLT